MPAKIYYDSDREHHKKVGRHYYQNNQQSILEHKKKRIQQFKLRKEKKRAIYLKNCQNNLSEDAKNIKRAEVKSRYHNVAEDKMLELKACQKEYQKKYRETKKAQGNLAKDAVLIP